MSVYRIFLRFAHTSGIPNSWGASAYGYDLIPKRQPILIIFILSQAVRSGQNKSDIVVQKQT